MKVIFGSVRQKHCGLSYLLVLTRTNTLSVGELPRGSISLYVHMHSECAGFIPCYCPTGCLSVSTVCVYVCVCVCVFINEWDGGWVYV